MVILMIVYALLFLVGIYFLVRSIQGFFSHKFKSIIFIISAIVFIAPVTYVVIVFYFGFQEGTMRANETEAIGRLKQLAAAEIVWHREDPDRNGIKDFWTYDVSCLHRMYHKDSKTKWAIIPLELARTDAKFASIDGNIFGSDLLYENWIGSGPNYYDLTMPKNGYWFRAMVTDENGVPYNQNPVGSNKVLATNSAKFAFVAYPDKYGVSGFRTFIVNETGKIWSMDRGDDKDKIILQWPGRNPALVKGPTGDYWESAE